MGRLVAIAADLSLRDASRVLCQPVSRLRALRKAGLVTWPDDASPRLAQDVLVTARKLGSVPTAKLARLAAVVVGPPSSIEVVVPGRRLTVRDSAGVFVVRSGQGLLNFSTAPRDVDVVPLRRRASNEPKLDLVQLLHEAQSLGSSAPVAARGLLQRILDEDPSFIPAKFELAAVEEGLSSFAAAEELYRSILATGPDAAAFAGLGRVLDGQNRLEDATAAYLSAVAIAADDFDTHRRLACCYRKASQPFLALKHQRLAAKQSRAR